MELIAREERGVIVLIRDLRPHSVSEWIATRSPDPRAGRSQERRLVEIGIGSQILRDLGVSEMILLSNQPQSRYVGLEGYGLSIVGKRRIE
jgi:3,4-dihydroxy 2-butanone 4-phosphate synthase/GTP cyclohydrolase II